jgi:arsenate reductase
MRSILFLCQHGGAKSVIAASHFNRLAVERGLPFVATAGSAEEPYDAVPAAVADRLHSDGFDVRAFKPRRASAADIDGAAKIVTIGCDLPDVAAVQWNDVPAASEDLEGSVNAIRRHVEALAEELDGER